ncbi:MAG: right-handed parallel beta-helix repeat-containing protein, partial [Methanobacterium formicicum]
MKKNLIIMFIVFFLAIILSGSVYATDYETTKVSVSSNGNQGNGYSGNPVVSDDGQYVAFESTSSNLVTGDTNWDRDVFVHDLNNSETEIVSVSSTGVQGNYESRNPDISGDGRYVVFQSMADNLVTGDTNGCSDIFRHDRSTGETIRVSVASDGTQANMGSWEPSISADGRFVVFESNANNLINNDYNDNRDIFIHDILTGQTSIVSVDSNGYLANGGSGRASISADGTYVAFESSASNLVVNDNNNQMDIFIRNRVSGQTTRASVNTNEQEADGSSTFASISGDGSRVTFISYATNLVTNDNNGCVDVFLRDTTTGTTNRVSVNSNGQEANNHNDYPDISPDGNFVVFRSQATNLVTDDTNGKMDTFTHNLSSGETSRISVDSDGNQGNGDSYSGSISSNGAVTVFSSAATNLVTGDTNGVGDVFARVALAGFDGHVYPGESIQDEVNLASDGSTITVHDNSENPYTYLENIILNKKLQLVALGDVTIASLSSSTPVIEINSMGSGSSISGFTITGGLQGVYLNLAENCTVLSNTITNNNYGVEVFGGQNNTLNENNISSNTVSGVFINNTSYSSLTRNHITNNQLGILLDHPVELTANFNRISNNTLCGLSYVEGDWFIDFENNWWGSNNETDIIGDINNLSGEFIDYTPWIILKLSTNPKTISQDGSSVLTADFRFNSFDENISSISQIPDGTPVTFTSDRGSLDSDTVNTVSGIANATLTVNEGPGKATVTAGSDDETLNSHVYVAGVINDRTGAIFSTIQAAIDSALNGDTIHAYGSFNENVILNKSLSLVGDGTIINAFNSNLPVISLNNEASGSIVQGFILSGGFCGIRLANSSGNQVLENIINYNSYGIILENSTNNNITNNLVETSTNDGVYLDAYSHNNTLYNNNVFNNSGMGIYQYGTDTKTCEGNTFIQNNINGNHLDGIRINYSSNSLLSQNTIKDNYFSGVNLYFSRNNILDHNLIQNNLLKGVWIYFSTNNILQDNNIIDNGEYGILVHSQSNNNNLTRNNITSNIKGISIEDSDYNQIYLNNIHSNQDGIILKNIGTFESSSHNQVIENNISQNTGYGIYCYSSPENLIYNNNFLNNTIQAFDNSYNQFYFTGTTNGGYYFTGGNYWSDYSGTDNNYDGFGDTPYVITGDSNSQDCFPYINQIINVFPGDSLQETIENALAGQTILVHDNFGLPYTYYGNFVLDKPLFIRANGNVTIQDLLEDTTPLFTINSLGSGSTIQGFNLSMDCGVTLWLINSSHNRILDNRITSSNEIGINAQNSSYNLIDNNNIANQDYGFNANTGSTNNIITNNLLGNNGDSIKLEDGSNNTMVVGNSIENSSYYGLYIYNSSHNQIYNNNFLDNHVQADIQGNSIENSFYDQKWGGNYWSDHNSPDSNDDGYVDSPYYVSGESDIYPYTSKISNLIAGDSIQEAIDGASINGKIILRDNNGNPVTYEADVTVNKKLTIQADGDVTVQSTTPGSPAFIVTSGGDGSTLEGFNIIAHSPGIYLENAANIVISGMNITSDPDNSDWVGIYLLNCLNITLINNNITLYTTNSTGNWTGILLVNSTSCTIQNNNITGSQLNETWTGIKLENNSDNTTIIGNNITSCSTGLILNNSYGNNITDNYVSRNNAGILIDNAQATVDSNIIENHVADGINVMNSSGNIITNNQITNSGTADSSVAAITLYQSTDNQIRNNTIVEGGINLYGTENPTSGNIIEDNNISGHLNNPEYAPGTGIKLYEANDNSINGNYIHDNEGPGIYLENCNGNILENNNLDNNAVGIQMSQSNGNHIISNQISNNGLGGIYIDQSGSETSPNIISQNTLTNNGIASITSSYNQFQNNNIVNEGFFFSNSNYNTLTGNVITDIGFAPGINLLGSSYNFFIDNNVSGCQTGINLIIGSNQNTICGNTIEGNDQGVNIQSGNLDNIIYNNNFIGNTVQAYVENEEDNNIFNMDYWVGGNYWSDYAGTNRGDGFGDTSYTFTGGEDNLPYIKQIWNVFPGESIQDAINSASSGDNIVVHDDKGNLFIYGENLTVNKPLQIRSDGDVTVQTPDPVQSVFSIFSSASGTTIQGFTLTGQYDDLGWGAIAISQVTGCNIMDNAFTDNLVSISLVLSSYNNLMGNVGSGIIYVGGSSYNLIAGNDGLCISLDGSDYNNITQNYIDGSYESGIILDGSSSNEISDNTVNNCETGIKIQNSSNNNITHNQIQYNTGNGIYIQSGTGNSIFNDNYIADNNAGILLEDTQATVDGNTIENHFADGINVMGGSENIITGNQFSNCGTADGSVAAITLFDTSNNVITHNSITGSKINLYSDQNLTTGNLIDNNEISEHLYGQGTSMGTGIDLHGANENTITNNYIHDNEGPGIYLENCSSNTLELNIINNNAVGIQMSQTDGTNIIGNQITNNGLGGIYMENSGSELYPNSVIGNNLTNVIGLISSSYNEFRGNNITNEGFYLSNSDYNTLSSNNITSVTGGAGILLISFSDNNYIIDNNITSCQTGIQLVVTYNDPNNNNIVCGNSLRNNGEGVNVSSGNYNNVFYNNNFINNTIQATVGNNADGNRFNLDYWVGGNYWSDYTGTNRGDGFGSTPYTFSGGQDNLPYIQEILNVFPGDSIQDAIDSASDGDNIIVHDNYGLPYIYNEYLTIHTSLRIKADGNITIQTSGNLQPLLTIPTGGNSSTIQGFTLNGQNNVLIVNITDSITTTFNNMVFANGGGSPARGAILNDNSNGSLFVNNCTFTNNNATGNNGGAIYSNGILTITNSNFTNNTATQAGSIYNKGTLTINNSNFTQNYASYYGGAIYNSYGTLTINNTNFTKNNALYGGAIYIQGTAQNTVNIINSLLTYNNASNGGGALYSQSVQLIIYNCTLTGNNATSSSSNGGALYINGGSATISDSNLSRNNAGNYGGAIYTVGTFNMNNSLLTYNTATNKGGALYGESGNRIISNCTLTGNNATGSSYGYGGAICINSGILNITNSTVQGNKAQYGGGIYNLGTCTISNCTLTGNTATAGYGGAVYLFNSGSTTINDTNISLNTASSYGGGICSLSSTLNIINSSINQNSGSLLGAGIYISGGTLSVTNSTLYGNIASYRGGALFINSGTGSVTITNSTISQNKMLLSGSAYGGGAIYNQATVNIVNSTLSDNNAPTNGGALYNTGTSNITNSTLTGNTATTSTGYGGAIYNSGNLNINNSIFQSNIVNGYGGVIYNPGNTTIINSTLNGNRASNGGVISNQGNLTITNSNFTGNNATTNGGTIQSSSGKINITDSTFTSNSGRTFGGGIYSSSSTINIINSTFTGNNATYNSGSSGAALYSDQSTLNITNSTFVGNNGSLYGAIASIKSTLIMNNSLLTGNKANYFAGAIYNGDSSTATINNSIFTGNTAFYGGGAIVTEYTNSLLNINNSTFTGNNASNTYGGGAVCVLGGTANITNSTLTDNTAPNGGAVYVYLNTCTVNITSSTFTGNNATTNGGAIYNAGILTMHFNRIVGNFPNAIWTNLAVNATNNWWGTNNGSEIASAIVGAVDYDPWIVLTLFSAYTTPGNSCVVTATLKYNSNGEDTSNTGNYAPNGITTTFNCYTPDD